MIFEWVLLLLMILLVAPGIASIIRRILTSLTLFLFSLFIKPEEAFRINYQKLYADAKRPRVTLFNLLQEHESYFKTVEDYAFELLTSTGVRHNRFAKILILKIIRIARRRRGLL